MSYIIGLTGGIGSGKTTVANLFAAKGIDVIDADLIAREVVAPGSKALKSIHDYFGPTALTANGELNRAELRRLIFANHQNKQWLENLLHPLIRTTILERLSESSSAYSLLVAPLLLETDLYKHAHSILVVDVTKATQIKRTSSRDGNTVEQVNAIIETQISRDKRLEKADYVIDNESSYDTLVAQVDELDAIFSAHAKQFSA